MIKGIGARSARLTVARGRAGQRHIRIEPLSPIAVQKELEDRRQA